MMSLSIRSKVFLVIFLACALTVTAGIALFNHRVNHAFENYQNRKDAAYLEELASELEYYFDEHGSWQTLRLDRRQWGRIVRNIEGSVSQGISRPRQRGRNRERAHPPGPPIPRRIALFDAQKKHIRGRQTPNPPVMLLSLTHDSQTVGYVGLYPRPKQPDGSEDAKFVNEIRKAFILVGLLTLLSSLLIAFLFSRQLVKPIHSLRRSTSALASGDYGTRIKDQGNDELGALSRDFNHLANSLQQHEQSRQQWIMDIAHELRTPISILRGEIEAIQDGIARAEPETIQSLHQETLHLQRLVEDLYMLSMSDSGSLTYQKTQLNLSELLNESIGQFTNQLQENNLQLRTNIPSQTVWYYGDAQRLQQLFQNLLKNSLRYTDQPGKITVDLTARKHAIRINFSDSKPGVPDESLSKLFDRLYRVEGSRNRATGGAGIGLSICANIVQAHGGSISAEHSELGGLQISIHLPITND